jgi:hypothetical protein
MAIKRRKAPGGSRPLPPGKRREKPMPLKLSTSERSVIDRAAEMDHDKPVGWTRRVAVIAAEHRIQGITIQEAYAAAMIARGQIQK